jgi:hypothetical protein
MESGVSRNAGSCKRRAAPQEGGHGTRAASAKQSRFRRRRHRRALLLPDTIGHAGRVGDVWRTPASTALTTDRYRSTPGAVTPARPPFRPKLDNAGAGASLLLRRRAPVSRDCSSSSTPTASVTVGGADAPRFGCGSAVVRPDDAGDRCRILADRQSRRGPRRVVPLSKGSTKLAGDAESAPPPGVPTALSWGDGVLASDDEEHCRRSRQTAARARGMRSPPARRRRCRNGTPTAMPTDTATAARPAPTMQHSPGADLTGTRHR